MKTIIILVIAIVLASCQHSSTPVLKSYSCPSLKPIYSKRKLQKASFNSRYSLLLDDSLVVASATQVQFDSTLNQLVTFDRYFQRLLFYDLRKTSCVRQINLSKNEFSKNLITSFKIINRDSLIVFNSSRNKFYLISSKGKILLEKPLKKPISQDRFVAYPSPFIQNASPIYWDKGKVITTGFLFGEHDKIDPAKRFCRIITPLNDAESTFDIKYPSIYDSANWGGDFYRSVYSMMDHSGIMYISFPAEHRLLQIKGEKLTWVSGSYPGMKCIPSLPDPKDSLRNRSYHFKINEHYATNYSYKNIFYLPHDKIFIRILELPLKLSQLNSDRTGIKPCELIIFDENHHYISRINLPDTLSSNNFFITDEGICFLNTKNKNENIAQYSLLRLNFN